MSDERKTNVSETTKSRLALLEFENLLAKGLKRDFHGQIRYTVEISEGGIVRTTEEIIQHKNFK